nr:hypothetical protein [Tanacetum cinerariifolium]
MATIIEQQVAMDEALVPSTQRCPFFKAFLVTVDVPKIYMQEFWATAYVHQHSIRFKMNNKKYIVNLESFRDMLHICPRIPGQSFDELLFEEEILDFIRFLRHSATIRTLIDVNINKLYQPWRSFATIINKCLTGKSSGYDRSVHPKEKQGEYVRDEFLFSTIKVVSRHQNTQQYGAMLPIELTNDEIKNTKAYKEYYAFSTGEAAHKPKASARRKRSGSNTSITPPTATVTSKSTIAATLRLTVAAKGKQPAKATKAKSPSALSEVQIKELVLNRGSRCTTDESEEELSWNSSDDEGDDDQRKDGDNDWGEKNQVNDEGDEEDESDEGEEDADEDKDGDERDDDEENQEIAKYDEQDDAERGGNDEEEGESDEEDDNKETRDEESFDPIPKTPESSEDEGDSEEDQGLNVNEEEHVEEEEEDELYRDVNINQGRGLQATLEVKDSHVTLTQVNPDGQQESSSVSSQFVTSMLNPTSNVDRLRDAYQRENDEFLRTIDENMKRIIKEQVKGQVKEQVSRILPRIKQSVNAQLEAEVLTRSSHSSRTSYAVDADLSEMKLKKILIEKMEGNKSIQCSDEQRNLYKAIIDAYEADKIFLNSYGETVILKRRRDDNDDKDEGPSARSDRGSKRRRKAVQGSTQTWISELVKQAYSRSSFNELLDTPLDFSNFIMNQLRVDTLTPEILAGPTYELTEGSCEILIELEYHLEEVYKETTDQLDWVNHEGQQYPHNLLQPLPLIPNNRGSLVIPFAHFITNDLEYLRGGASSRKYTTSVTKTKAADYGHIKWIEDLVPSTMWIQEPIDYDKHALWGVSHWGRKRQQFYDFAVNQESARDVYSKRRIIAFKEGDFKRLCLQDIEDMLLLLVQGKLSNLTDEERVAFNVSLKMFTRSIVIQRRVEDLQLGVKSYQKRLNLTNPDTYRSDLKRREAYFIYQNKDKKNRLMRVDELHKFSDGTLNNVRTAPDDRLNGIRMQYLPQTIWRKGDKDRAAAMI